MIVVEMREKSHLNLYRKIIAQQDLELYSFWLGLKSQLPTSTSFVWQSEPRQNLTGQFSNWGSSVSDYHGNCVRIKRDLEHYHWDVVACTEQFYIACTGIQKTGDGIDVNKSMLYKWLKNSPLRNIVHYLNFSPTVYNFYGGGMLMQSTSIYKDINEYDGSGSGDGSGDFDDDEDQLRITHRTTSTTVRYTDTTTDDVRILHFGKHHHRFSTTQATIIEYDFKTTRGPSDVDDDETYFIEIDDRGTTEGPAKEEEVPSDSFAMLPSLRLTLVAVVFYALVGIV